jgi:hypothetical protein
VTGAGSHSPSPQPVTGKPALLFLSTIEGYRLKSVKRSRYVDSDSKQIPALSAI